MGAGFRLGEAADGLDGLQRVAEGLDGGEPTAELGGAGASVEVAEEVRVEGHADVAVGGGDVVVREARGELVAEGEQRGEVVREGGVLQGAAAFGGFEDVGGIAQADVREEPGVREGGASDHDGGDAGLGHELQRVDVVDAAVSGDGDLRLLDEIREEVVVDGSAVHLRGEAAVEDEAGAAGGLRGVEQLEEEDRVGTRPGARLDREG